MAETDTVEPSLQPAGRFCAQHLRQGPPCENRTAEQQHN